MCASVCVCVRVYFLFRLPQQFLQQFRTIQQIPNRGTMTIKWHIFATIILIQLKSFHCNTIELSSYSRVAKNGGNADANAHTDQPTEVHRAREDVINSDLWQPKT